MTIEEFTALLQPVINSIQGKPLDHRTQSELNAAFGSGSAEFASISCACHAAIAAGWMCNREGGGIKFGRVIKPDPATGGFSVDVVSMNDVVGPFHSHPNGEVDLIMPIDGGAQFDGHGAGWLVYGPSTAHRPTVTGGNALVLYLLPDGAIDFKAPEVRST